MNLIICCTPLQVLIAEKIIDLHPNENFYGVMIAAISNEKYRYYSKRLEKKCKRFRFFTEKELKTKRNIFSFSYDFLKKAIPFTFLKFSKIFVANTEKYLVRFIVNKNKFADIYTFDDGTRNLLQKDLKLEKKISLKNKIFSLLIGIKGMSNKKIIEKSKLHFTIYKNFKNIIPETFYINIFPKEIKNNIPLSTNKPIKFFLGQKFYTNDSKNIQLIKKIINMFNIDFYIPHPIENYIIDDVQYIQTKLIFEDYFIENLIDKNCEIYSFFSTSLLNLPKIDNVKIIALKPKNIENTYISIDDMEEIYNILSLSNCYIKNVS